MTDIAASHKTTLRGPLFYIAIAFSVFQIWMASYQPLSSQVVRALHVGFVLLLIYTLYPPFESARSSVRRFGLALGWMLGLAGFATGLYQWVFEADLTQRAGEIVGADWWVGPVLLVLVFEAARRVMGWGLPVVCAVFLAYAVWGQSMR